MSVAEKNAVAWVSADEMQQNLKLYLQRVQEGESLVITVAGRPVAEVKPASRRSRSLRPFGLCAGEFTVPDDFDAPLPENIVREFEGR